MVSPRSPVNDDVAGETAVNELLRMVRRAQRDWALVPIRQRLQYVRRLRDVLARDARGLTQCFSGELERTPADSLSAEILPLAEAARFLERNAERLLRPQVLPTQERVLWLRKVNLELLREPLGVVLVIGPSNYPLFLPGVQALQALTAGNAVVLKPGKGGGEVALRLCRMAEDAGIPKGLFTVLDESVDAARETLRAGVDKVVMTGSATSGIALLHDAAETITPAVVELSGCDAVFVCADADITKAAQAVAFGLTLNGGATCIAPRRIFVHRSVADGLEVALTAALECITPMRVIPVAARFAEDVIRQALSQGARLSDQYADFSPEAFQPVIVFDVSPEMEIMRSDIFAPVASVLRVESDEEALAFNRLCPYALGATIFGGKRNARRLAERVSAGVVVVNDIIVPTADPRLPFGGCGRSGFGKTRGAEGLLEMTKLKAVATQSARRLRHLEKPHPKATELFLAFLAARHRRHWMDRLQAWRKLGAIVTGKIS